MIFSRILIDGRRRARFSVLLCLIFCAAFAAVPQSGRRSPPVKSPSPVETPAPPPAPKPKADEKPSLKPEISLSIVSNIPESMRLQLVFPERVTGWVTERLRGSPLLEVASGGEGRMKEAQAMAKNSEGRFIVLLELEENPFAVPRAGGTRATAGEVWINFTVLEPGTGKIKQKGRSDLKPELLNRRGSVINDRNLCYPNLTREDYLLLEASQEAAERIMAGFNLPIPPVKCR